MNNRIYEAAVSLTLGKIENGEAQAIESTLWVMRHLINDPDELCTRLTQIFFG